MNLYDDKVTAIADVENNIYRLYDANNNLLAIPESIAIILDGNGRYAKRHNLPRALGHKKGCETLEVILEESVRIGVKFLTVYAFSTENWKRSREEINALFDLFFLYLEKVYKKAIENNVKIYFIGKIEEFPDNIYNECKKLMNDTKDFTRMTFTIAFNYGSRDEILRAIKKIDNDKVNVQDLTEKDINKYLDTNIVKDPDLLIRTSGECRISNFLLWQIAYSEIYITNIFWPDFGKEPLKDAILEFANRQRRWGK